MSNSEKKGSKEDKEKKIFIFMRKNKFHEF